MLGHNAWPVHNAWPAGQCARIMRRFNSRREAEKAVREWKRTVSNDCVIPNNSQNGPSHLPKKKSWSRIVLPYHRAWERAKLGKAIREVESLYDEEWAKLAIGWKIHEPKLADQIMKYNSRMHGTLCSEDPWIIWR